MAYDDDTRRKVRAAFVFDQLDLTLAAAKLAVPYETARRWKREALAAGDDWERARSAQMIAGGSLEEVSRQTLAVVVQQVQAVVQAIQQADDMLPQDKVEMLASLADAYNKLMASSRRLMPETDALAIRMDTIKRLGEFVRVKFPRHAAAFAELLEPFAQELAHG